MRLDEGIGQEREAKLEHFQTHGMRCSDGTVELLAWDAVHVVDLSDREQPRFVKKVALRHKGERPDGFADENLGPWARVQGRSTQAVLLPSSDTRHTYWLVIEVSEKSGNGRGRPSLGYRMRSRIVQRDKQDRTVASRVVFEGEQLTETVD